MADAFPTDRFRIDVSPDQMSATLCTDGAIGVTPAEVIARAREMKIESVDTAAINSVLAITTPGPISVVIAQGTSPVDERGGRVNFKIPVADLQNGTVSRVEPKMLIGIAGKSAPGVDGKDIFGKTIVHQKKPLPFQLASGLVLKKDEIIAEEPGNLRMKDDRLCIIPLLEVNGDEENTGPMLTFDGDISIKGSLREGRGVNAKGALLIAGSVKASFLKVGASAYTKGGFIGKNKAKCVIGDELRCAFVTGTAIVAGGDVHVQTEIQGSRIFCSGQLHITRGPIIGGEISANGGVHCQTLGNLMGVPTVIGAGTDRVTKSLVAAATAESDANKKKIADTRAKITPLMEKLKSLTPEQRERVTELMYEAEELEGKNEEMLAELFKRSQLMQQRAKAEILVAELIYPGVKIRLPGVEATISKSILGPIKISLGQVAGNPVIQVTDASSPNPYTLAADPVSSSTQVPTKIAA